jgi:adhesin/invasin
MMMLSRISFVCAALVAIVAVACDTMPLTAPSGSALTISAGSTLVPTGGTTEIRAYVLEASGTAVQNGTTVHFSTNLGRVDPIDALTTNGYAVTTFMAGDSSGVADVSATSGGTGATTPPSTDNGSDATPSTTNSNVVRITVGGAAATVVVLNASPSNVPPIGGTVTMVAAVLDANGNRLRNLPVTFSADRGTLSATVANTDGNGEARVQLTTNQETIVTARAGAATAAATFTVRVDDNIKVELANPMLGATNPLQLKITPARGTPVVNVTVDFGDGDATGLGAITGETFVTHRYQTGGTYPVRATQSNANGSTYTATLVVIVP